MKQQEFISPGNDFVNLVEKCIDLHDQTRVIHLKQFGCSFSSYQKIVKFKSNQLKQIFKAGIENEVRETNQYSLNNDETNQNNCELFDAMQDLTKKFKENLQSEIGRDNFLGSFKTLDQLNKQQLALLQRFIPVKVSECYQKFYNQAEKLLDGQDCQKRDELLEDLRNGVLIKYKDYIWGNPRRFNSHLKCLQILPEYRDYQRYLGINIQAKAINFKRYLLKQLMMHKDIFAPGQILFIVQQFQQDYMWNFQSYLDFTLKQKDILHRICWKQHNVKEYVLAANGPLTLKFKVREVTQQMMDYLIKNELIRTGQYQAVISALKEFDANKFYSISSIANSRSLIVDSFQTIAISQGFAKNRYFYQNQINGCSCLYEKKIEFILKIRNFLKQLQVQSKLYQSIQEKLLNNRILQLWNEPIPVQTRQKIVQFYQQQDKTCNYRTILGSITPLDIQVMAEIQNILLKLDFKDLSFKDIRQITRKYMQTKILPPRINPDQQRMFTQQIKKAEIDKKYFDNLGLDKEITMANLSQELIYLFNSLPGLISYENIKQIIERLLQQCDLNVIYDSQHLSYLQKTNLEQQIENNLEIKNYKKMIRKLNYIKNKEQFQKYLSDNFGPNASIIFDYLMKNRKIQFNSEGKIEPGASQTKALDILLANKQEQIKNMHQSQCYQKFNEAYDFLLGENKKELQYKLGVSIKQIFYENGRSQPDLSTLIDNNFNLDLLPEDIKGLVTMKPIYKEYNSLLQSVAKNQSHKNKCELQKYISSTIRSYHTLRKYSVEQRNNFIQGLGREGLSYLKSEMFISEADKQQISNMILNCDQWLKCYPKKQPQFVPKAAQKIQDGSKSPTKVSTKVEKKKSNEQLTQEFINQLKNGCNFPAEISDDLIKLHVKKNLFDNLKDFIKKTGVKGLMVINNLQAAILKEKQNLMKILDQMNEEKSEQSQQKQKGSTTEKKQKIQQTTETNPFNPNPENEEPYQKIAQILRNCPGIPPNISQQKLRSALKQKIYTDPKNFLKSIGVGLMKVKDAVIFMEERKSEIEPIANACL